jgi:hypothetical protein
MGKIYVLPKDAKGRQPCMRNESLPHFYMSDHSVLGVLVREFREAILILEKQKWPLTRKKTGVEVFIRDASHMQDLFRVFKKFRLDFEIADVFDQVYQG